MSERRGRSERLLEVVLLFAPKLTAALERLRSVVASRELRELYEGYFQFLLPLALGNEAKRERGG